MMEKIQIKARPFFDLLKEKDQSMWEIFSQLMGEDKKELIFINEDGSILFNYVLPNSIEELRKEQAVFTEEFKNKVKSMYN